MTRFVQVAVLMGGSALVALGSQLADAGTNWAALALIGGAIAAGELIELRPPLRMPLPISFAFMVVLAERASVEDATLVLLVALLASFLVRPEPSSLEGRLVLFVERLAEGLGAVVVYHAVVSAVGRPTERAGELLALAAASVTPDPHRRARSDRSASVTSASRCTAAPPTSR